MLVKSYPALAGRIAACLQDILGSALRAAAEKGRPRVELFIRNQERVDRDADRGGPSADEGPLSVRAGSSGFSVAARPSPSGAGRVDLEVDGAGSGGDGAADGGLRLMLSPLDALGLHWRFLGPEGEGDGDGEVEIPSDGGAAYRERALAIVEDDYIQTFYEFFKTHNISRLFAGDGLARRAGRLLRDRGPRAGAAPAFEGYVMLSESLLEFTGLGENPFLRSVLGVETRLVEARELERAAAASPEFLARTDPRASRRDGIGEYGERHFIDLKRLLEFLVVGLFSLRGVALPDDVQGLVGDLIADYRSGDRKRGFTFGEFLKNRLGGLAERRRSLQIVLVAPIDGVEPMVLLQDNLRKRRRGEGWKDWKLVTARLRPGAGSSLADAARVLLERELGLGPGDYEDPGKVEVKTILETKASKRTKGIVVEYEYDAMVLRLEPSGALKLYDAYRRGRPSLSGTRSFSLRRAPDYRYAWVSASSALSQSVEIEGEPAIVAGSARKILAAVEIPAERRRIELLSADIPREIFLGRPFFASSRRGGLLALDLSSAGGDGGYREYARPLHDAAALMTIERTRARIVERPASAAARDRGPARAARFLKGRLSGRLVSARLADGIVDKAWAATGGAGGIEGAYLAQGRAVGSGPILEFASFAALSIARGFADGSD